MRRRVEDRVGYWTMTPSINEQLAALPKRRDSVAKLKGLILFLPRTRHAVVPLDWVRGGYNCVVVDAPADSAYPVGGYDIFVSDIELMTGIELTVDFRRGDATS